MADHPESNVPRITSKPAYLGLDGVRVCEELGFGFGVGQVEPDEFVVQTTYRLLRLYKNESCQSVASRVRKALILDLL